jgi:hypothetical protein
MSVERTQLGHQIRYELRHDAAQFRAWLTPIVGPGPAAELTDAVDAQPPLTSGWQRHNGG